MMITSNQETLVKMIKDLVANNSYVSEIETNGLGSLFYKERGKRKSMPLPLKTEEEYNEAVDYLIKNAGLIKAKYLVEGRYSLSDDRFGRLHIVMPPASTIPQITLAIKTSSLNSLAAIQNAGSFDTEMSKFLKAAIQSRLTICISGGTGHGKALHKDTKIPTPLGMKTVDSLNVGDIIFDEKGNETKILKKYCPNDPKSYEIVFKSGQKVRTSAGHLWEVTKLNKKDKIGPHVKEIFTDKEIDELKRSLSSESFISAKNVKKIIKNHNSLFTLITKEAKMFKGSELVIFNPEELKCLFERTQLSKRINLTNDDILTNKSWQEIKNASNKTGRIDNWKTRLLIETKSFSTKETYFKKNEILNVILNDCERRRDYQENRTKHLSKKDIRPREILTTEQMFENGIRNQKGRLEFAIDYLNEPVNYKTKDLKVEPYVLGAWLGDGISDRAVLCGTDREIHERILNYYELEKETVDRREHQTMDLYGWRYKELVNDLKHYNLIRNKHIPEDYKLSSKQQRIDLISGLVDTDGSIDKSGIATFGNTNKKMVEDAREIVMSLGWSTTKITSKTGRYKDQDGNTVYCKEIYTFGFVNKDLKLEVPRKRERLKHRSKNDNNRTQEIRHYRHYIYEINEIEDNKEDYYCFQVDSPSHLFLCTEEFIPTHNTTLLEALTSEFDENERVGVCEDSPELMLQKTPNSTYLTSTVWVPGMRPEDVADLNWIVKQINRMRVDRIIIGETRGPEFFEFVTAANSGAEGSLTTIHANDSPSAMKKMATFSFMAVDMNPRIINEMISSAVDLVIQLGKSKVTGDHKILSIDEITNAISSGDSPTIALNPLFTYDHETNTWNKRFATDKLKDRLEMHGFNPNTYAKKEEEASQFSTQGGLPTYFNKEMN